MAKFTRGKYQSDQGSIHPIRMDEDRYAAAGAAPSGAADSEVKVKISKNNTEFGIRPRGLRLALEETSGTVTSTRYSFLPVLTPTAFAAFSVNGTVTIGEDDWTIIAKTPEDY